MINDTYWKAGRSFLLGWIAYSLPFIAQGQKFSRPEIFADGIISTVEGYETHPAFSASGDTVYFLQCAADLSKSAIYFSVKRQGRWGQPQLMPISGKYFDADPFITTDGNSMYFTSNRPLIPGDPVRPDTDIWKIEKTTSGAWGEPVHLGSTINSNHSEHYPTIAANGNMYFGSERAGGKGGADIYCSRFVNEKFSSPENLGDAINSPDNEYEPFIAKDEQYLIFMATRPNGLLNADFYISYNKFGSWTKAIKLNTIINSAATEWAPKVSTDGKYFYFGSTRNRNPAAGSNGLSDIYQVDMEALKMEKNKPRSKDSLKGEVQALIQSMDAKMAVSILHIESRDIVSYNGDTQLPMLSVYKFPIAMAVLSQVDKGNLKMEQQINIDRELVHPGDSAIFSEKNFSQGKATIEALLSLMLVHGT